MRLAGGRTIANTTLASAGSPPTMLEVAPVGLSGPTPKPGERCLGITPDDFERDAKCAPANRRYPWQI